MGQTPLELVLESHSIRLLSQFIAIDAMVSLFKTNKRIHTARSLLLCDVTIDDGCRDMADLRHGGNIIDAKN